MKAMKLRPGQKEKILEDVRVIRKETENRCHVWMVIETYHVLEGEGLLEEHDYRIDEILESNMVEAENNPNFKSKMKTTAKYHCLLCGAVKVE